MSQSHPGATNSPDPDPWAVRRPQGRYRPILGVFGAVRLRPRKTRPQDRPGSPVSTTPGPRCLRIPASRSRIARRGWWMDSRPASPSVRPTQPGYGLHVATYGGQPIHGPRRCGGSRIRTGGSLVAAFRPRRRLDQRPTPRGCRPASNWSTSPPTRYRWANRLPRSRSHRCRRLVRHHSNMPARWSCGDWDLTARACVR